MDLNRADIIDIANGYRNTYVDSQDKDELLRAVADKYLKATSDTSDIDDNLDNIRDCLNDIDDILIEHDGKDGVYNSVIKKIADIEEYLDEVRNALQSVIE